MERVADSALTIVVLVTWVLIERREKALLWERFEKCLDKITEHIEEHIG